MVGIGLKDESIRETKAGQPLNICPPHSLENGKIPLGNGKYCRRIFPDTGQQLPGLLQHETGMNQLAKGGMIGPGKQGLFQFRAGLQPHTHHPDTSSHQLFLHPGDQQNRFCQTERTIFAVPVKKGKTAARHHKHGINPHKIRTKANNLGYRPAQAGKILFRQPNHQLEAKFHALFFQQFRGTDGIFSAVPAQASAKDQIIKGLGPEFDDPHMATAQKGDPLAGDVIRPGRQPDLLHNAALDKRGDTIQ